MKIEYDHSKIEKDIQSKWDESNAFTVKIDNEKPNIIVYQCFHTHQATCIWDMLEIMQ